MSEINISARSFFRNGHISSHFDTEVEARAWLYKQSRVNLCHYGIVKENGYIIYELGEKEEGVKYDGINQKTIKEN